MREKYKRGAEKERKLSGKQHNQEREKVPEELSSKKNSKELPSGSSSQRELRGSKNTEGK